MRKVNFKVRNIGSEKYLSYVLDDETDFDEELLDYLDENKITELIDIIYEEDDENDYLTSTRSNANSLLLVCAPIFSSFSLNDRIRSRLDIILLWAM